MKILRLIIVLLSTSSVFLFAKTDAFIIDLGDSSISDSNIDFNTRGFNKYQDYIDLIDCEDDFKLYINTVNGNLYHQRLDYFVDDIGIPIQIAFTYNSGSSFIGRFGNRWQSNYDIRYAQNNLNENMMIVYPDDRTSLFLYNKANETYSPFDNSFDKLYKDDDGKLRLEFSDEAISGAPKRLKVIFDIDGHHYAKSISDVNGNSANMTYNENNMLRAVTFQSGKSIIFEYNLNFLNKIILPGGKEVNYFYNIDGNLSSVQLPSEKYYLYKYDECGNLTNISNEHKEIIIAYNDLSQVTGLLNNYDDLVYTINYDTIARKTTLILPNKSVKTYKYDTLNRSVEYSYGDFATKKLWNTNNLLTELTDAKGNRTRYEYDVVGRITRIIYADNSIELFNWHYDGRELTHTMPNGESSNYKFDDEDQIKSYTNSQGKVIDVIRYRQGTISDFIYDNGLNISFLRDHLSRVRFVNINNESHLKIDYNFNDELNAITDIFRNITQFSYDQENRLVSVNYPNNSVYAVFYLDNINQAIVKKRDGESIDFSFDNIGRLTTLVDEAGSLSSFVYENSNLFYYTIGSRINSFEYASNRKIKSVKQNNKELLFSYSPNNLVSSIFYNGLTYSFKYDIFNHITEFKAPNGSSQKYEYNSSGNISSYTDENDRISLFYYDKYNRIIRKTKGSINIFYEYPSDNLVRLNFDNLRFIDYQYDDFKNLLTEFKSDIGEYAYNYDKIGNLIQITDPMFLTTVLTYDQNYNLNSLLFPSTYSVSFKYSQSNYMIEKKDNNDYGTKISYDSRGRITQIIDENLSIRTYTWDLFNNLALYKSKNSNVYSFNFTPDNILVTNPDNSQHSFNISGYFNNFLISSTTNSENSSIRLFYDNSGSPTRIVDDYNNSLRFNYNNHSFPSDFTNGSNESYYFTYDFLGRLINIKNPDNNNKTFFYNSLSKISNFIDYSGLSYLINYTDFNKLSSVSSQDFEIKYIYNQNKNLIAFHDYNSDLQFFKYNDINISEISSSSGDTVLLTYDNQNRLISKISENGTGYNYYYNPRGLLKDIISSNGNTLNFVRDNDDNITSVLLDNKQIGLFKYNNINKLTSVTTLDTNLLFNYNSSGNLIQANSSGSWVYQFNYDILGRLISVRYPDDKRESFKYDTKSNVVESNSIDEQVYNYEYNYNNQLIKSKWSRIDSLVVNYDNDGNISAIIEPNNTFSEFMWTAGNTLSKFNFFESGWAEFKLSTMQNMNHKIRLQFANGDTIAYIVDPALRFKGILVDDFIQNTYSKSGISLFNYQPLNSFDISNNEQYGISNGRFNWVKLGMDSLFISYDNISLVPKLLKSTFGNYSTIFTNNFQFKELWSNGKKMNDVSYNALGFLSRIILNDSNSFTLAYNSSGLIYSMNQNQIWQISLSYNNSNNLSSAFDNQGNSFSLFYDNKSNLRSINKSDNSKLDYLYDTFNNLIIFKNESYDESAFKYNKQNLVSLASYPNLSESELSYNQYFGTTNIKSNDLLKRDISLKSSLFGQNKSFSIQFSEKISYILNNESNKSLILNNITLRNIVSDSSYFKEFIISGNQVAKYEKHSVENNFILSNEMRYSIEKIDNYTDNHKFTDKNGNTIIDLRISYNDKSRIKSINTNNSMTYQSQFDNSDHLINYHYDNEFPINLKYAPDGRLLQIVYADSVTNNDYDANNKLVRSGNFSLSYDNRGNMISKALNSDTTFYVYNYNNVLIGIVQSNLDTTFLLYSPRESLIGIAGKDTTYFMPQSGASFTSYPHFSAIINSNGDAETVFDSFVIDEVRFTYSHNISTNEYKYYILSRDNSTLACVDNNGNLQTLINSISPLGKISNYDNLSVLASYRGMIAIPQIKLLYDGKRFYDPDINQFIQAENYHINEPFNTYSPKKNDNSRIDKYYHVDLDYVMPISNPFKNRFIYIDSEANPYSIIEDELMHHFNNFNSYSLKIVNKFETPVLEEYQTNAISPDDVIFSNLHKNKLRITPKLPESLFDTLLLKNRIRILPEKIKTTPKGNEFEIIQGYLDLTDIPKHSKINKAIEMILAMPKPYILNFQNVYNESRINADIDEVEKFISVNNRFYTILEDNMHNFSNEPNSSLHNIEKYLPLVKSDNFDLLDILSIGRNVSQLSSDIISPELFLDKKGKIAEKVLRNNISNFIKESLIISPKEIFPGRTHYENKFLPLPYSDESKNNHPSYNLRKKRLKFNLIKNN